MHLSSSYRLEVCCHHRTDMEGWCQGIRVAWLVGYSSACLSGWQPGSSQGQSSVYSAEQNIWFLLRCLWHSGLELTEKHQIIIPYSSSQTHHIERLSTWKKLWSLPHHIFQNHTLRCKISQDYFGAINKYINILCQVSSICCPFPLSPFSILLCVLGD